ncbi:MAG: ferritin-like domain-containing protein [Cyanobacteria bacterium P01_E01_bin.34]
MNSQYGVAGLQLPHSQPDDKLQRVLSAALAEPIQRSPSIDRPHYWGAEHFQLQRVKLFRESSGIEQQQILSLASRQLIGEAYWIEQAGVGYMAKMVLLAETAEERMLYGLFAADEAEHLAQIRRFVPETQPTNSGDPFLKMLAEVVETQDKALLLFAMQVVLEGWGTSHYRHLSAGCLNAELSHLFLDFLQAESRHHASGQILFSRMVLSQASQQVIAEVMVQFLRMIQAGPQRIVAAIERVKGHLSRSQKLSIFEQLDTETHSGTRLDLLRSLMQRAGGGAIVQTLEEQGAFQAFPANRCI